MEGSAMPLGKEDVAFLESMDTPTVCNVIEIVAPERRGNGYTTRHLHCASQPQGAGILNARFPRLSNALLAIRSDCQARIPRASSQIRRACRVSQSQRYRGHAADTNGVRCRRAQIDNATAHERPAIIDANHHGTSGVIIGNGDPCAKRQGPVGGGHRT
jgi:hypothetical protein